MEKTWRDWLRYTLTTQLFLIIGLWVTASLIIDFNRLWRNRRKSDLDFSKKWMKITAICLSFAVTLHFVDGVMEEIYVDLYNPDVCGVSKYIKAITGSFGFMFSYLVFWLRQRSLYCEPAMKHLTSALFRASSVVAFALIITYPVVSIGIYGATLTFAVVESGCAIVSSTIDPRIIWIYTAVSSFMMQIILLGLFLLPLYKHKAVMSGSGRDCNHLKPIIHRSLKTAIVCALSDTGTATLAAANVLNDGFTIGISMQISMLINLMAVVFSFSNWKRIIFWTPFRTAPVNTQRDSEIECSIVQSKPSKR